MIISPGTCETMQIYEEVSTVLSLFNYLEISFRERRYVFSTPRMW
jgi:hypothetical protein